MRAPFFRGANSLVRTSLSSKRSCDADMMMSACGLRLLHHRGRAKCADSSTPLSKGRAVCGSPARTDLCGGRFVRIVPTATPLLELEAVTRFVGWGNGLLGQLRPEEKLEHEA